ncbi:helix-turn-helix domain-containing protein [Promicromonospora xylanilytica]
MTAAQRRARAKAEYDAFLAACPSRMLLDQISNKWVTLTVSALGGYPSRTAGTDDTDVAHGTDSAGGPRPMRYSELSRQLAGVSQKMLTQTLRALERDGLVTRTATATVPVTVTYELTDLGRSLHQLVRSLKGWAESHMDDVLAHRAAHDARAS